MQAHNGSSDCADIKFIGVRGSGEEDRPEELSMGPTVYSAFQRFRTVLRPSWSVAGEGLSKAEGYQARPVSDLAVQGLGELDPQTWGHQKLRFFTNSIGGGRDTLMRHLQQTRRECPNTKIVLGGYSQGAMVVHQALNRLGGTWDGAKNIYGILLIADGDKVPGSSISTLPSPDIEKTAGVRAMIQAAWPGKATEDLPDPQDIPVRYRSRAVQLAFKGDIVADFTADTLPRVLSKAFNKATPSPMDIHRSYLGSPELDQAAVRLGEIVNGEFIRSLADGSDTGQSSRSVVASGQLHYFDRSPAGHLVHWWRDSPHGPIHRDTWNVPAKARSSKIVGRPVALADGARQHVWARTASGRLVHWVWNGKRVESYVWAAGVSGDPAASRYALKNVFPNSTGDQFHVFARTSTGSLGHWWMEPNGRVSTDVWVAPGVVAAQSRPVSYTWRNQQHVFARMSDGRLRHWWWFPGLKGKPLTDKWSDPGRVRSDPTGFPFRDRQQHVFYLTGGQQLVHKFWNTNGTLPVALRDEYWVGSPSAYTDGVRQYTAGRDRSNRLVVIGWDFAFDRDARISLAGAVAGDPTVTSWNGVVHVFCRGSNGHLRVWRLDSGASEDWQGAIAA